MTVTRKKPGFDPVSISTGASGSAAPSVNQDAALPEQLDYMADMIGELQHMAERSGYGILAGILRVAHAEARRQSATLTS
jgi:hypothetical protein